MDPKNTPASNRANEPPWVAILGNPNCGKTALFNRLTGLHHKVGNYPGITVEKKSGWIRGQKIELRDFPGTYSLNAKSIDEKIVADTVQSWRDPQKRPLAVIIVLDATNLHRNIYLALQLLDWNLPTIIVLNMMDEVRKKKIKIDHQKLQERLEARAVIPASAKEGEGIERIIQTILDIRKNPAVGKTKPRLLEVERFLNPIAPLLDLLQKHEDILRHDSLIEALRLISEAHYINNLIPLFSAEILEQIQDTVLEIRDTLKGLDIPYYALEQTARFAYIDLYLKGLIHESPVSKPTLSERIDSVLTHHIYGPLSLIIMLAFIFNAIFSWAQYPMEIIDNLVAALSGLVTHWMEPGILSDLLTEGVIGGVGSILIFLPQIILLVFFITLLEDSGYMARMAFMMDKIMLRLGLSGRSVLPLLSGFACAIPAVMSARTIDNWRERVITIMLIPLISCSARLPVYTILIAAFIPNTLIFGFISLQAATLMGVYFLGMFTAVFVALIFKKLYPPRVASSLIMELPPYRIPLLRSVFWQIYERGKSFLTTAGSIILAISIVLWFLASFPQMDNKPELTPAARITQSYAGQMGKFIEPAIEPLGFDWKIGIGLITSFAAREVIVSVLSTLYNIEEEGERKSLIEAMRADKKPDGTPLFTTLTALSLMIFFVYAAQCMATFAIIKRETNSWKWPSLMVIYMTTLAYLASFLLYQGGKLLGFG